MSEALRIGLEDCDRRLDPNSPAPVAVAFSGGGDSLAALLVAAAWAGRGGRKVLALHVDHGLQPGSGAWAARAQAQAAQLGAAFLRLPWNGPKPATGLPAAARAARHRLIAQAARAAGCKVVLFGHTLDDQLENAVMRQAGGPVGVLRPWGPSPAWPEGRGLFLLRPLLAVRRAALRDWLAAEGQGWLEDPANADDRFARPRARKAVSQGAQADAESVADISGLAAACRAESWGGLSLARERVLSAAPEAARRLLQQALACASGAQGAARSARVDSLLERLGAADRFTATLAGARVEAGATIRLSREAGEASRGGLAPLDLPPGQPVVWDGRFEISAAQPGWRVRALKGVAGRLQPADFAALRAFPASVRPSLPILHNHEGDLRPVCLALTGKDAHIDAVGGSITPLAQARLAAAAGWIAREVEIGTVAAWR